MKYFSLALSFLLFTFAYSAKGPQYRSLRVHGMGGAFVAISDSKDALYYNPAGLNLISRFGNFEKNPDMGYMPMNKSEIRLFSAVIFLPANETTKMLEACGAEKMGTIIKRVLFFDFGDFGDANYWCPTYYKLTQMENDSLRKYLKEDTTLAENVRKLDRSKIEIGTQLSFLELAIHNFGLSVWSNASAAPYVDLGIWVPTFGYEPIQIDMVAQTAFAFSPVDQWSVGAGLKFAKRYRQPNYDFKPSLDFKGDIQDIDINRDDLDSLEKRWENFGDEFNKANLAVGLDLGVLYQITREVRLGSSIRNIFFGELGGESITPNWSIGAMASPMILQSNSFWGRKVNFAIDYVDILDGTITEKFFAHLNFGAEIDQVIIPSPTKELSLGYRLLFGLAGGLVGLGVGSAIGDGYGAIGSAVGMGVGTLAGFKFGVGGDAVHVSFGGGWEGGYPAFNIGFGLLGDVIAMRFGSYAEERGLKTAQSEQRFWTGELSIGF